MRKYLIISRSQPRITNEKKNDIFIYIKFAQKNAEMLSAFEEIKHIKMQSFLFACEN